MENQETAKTAEPAEKPQEQPQSAPAWKPDLASMKDLAHLKRPLNLIVIGMAGSGKSTFLGKLQTYLTEVYHALPYMVNLDPAVTFLPFSPANDIRSEVNYKDVMAKYGLGPNGAIMTSLNLYAAKFHLTLDKMEEQQQSTKLFLVDTPGQIEVFTWSASGQIITTTMASICPTALVFIVDSVRCQSPNTFMSNMLFCCSILYKTKLPIVVVFNKNDIADASVPIGWMKNFDLFMDQVRKSSDYLSSLSRSMALALDEFYSNLTVASVSSVTGKGFDELIASLPTLIEEYEQFYEPDLIKAKYKHQADETQLNAEMAKFTKDLSQEKKK